MGSSASKVAGRAGGAAARRQYPSTPSIVNSAPSPTDAAIKPTPAAEVRPNATAAPPASEKTEHVELDARDPQFGSALRRVGVARPVTERRPDEDTFPTSSQPMHSGQNIFPSDANNPAMMLVHARKRIAAQWESELENQGRPGFAGRTLLSVKDIKEAFTLRDELGKSPQEIEKQMRLKPGVLDQLVAKDVVANV
ncbi:hypothetical protein AYO21_06654 [Fonsecaea monophora]|uniref:Helix-turn-helix domain-containing protein n=2 Tax=Fonsecaea TaxID=40354 RepID=A0A0D2GPH3_9EURO|nr:uncharacterized protein Z517_02121 [Fonsecaea pedrosoi CBS 271.37]XP_022511055.1 hypothetical protein AYO21_06654 [Fonsecaea monophora]KIW82878.1 hypothetical protein Z517_02121 [Fonsecaea pedrosoi CBS 271.37]OAG39103.1 hypothetical protein AYO21_06654 [Fonsecaea monophora]